MKSLANSGNFTKKCLISNGMNKVSSVDKILSSSIPVFEKHNKEFQNSYSFIKDLLGEKRIKFLASYNSLKYNFQQEKVVYRVVLLRCKLDNNQNQLKNINFELFD